MKLYLSQLFGTLLTFDRKIDELPGVSTFRFEAGSAKWRAGQYYVFFTPSALFDKRTPFRPFSISSAPDEGYIQITTRIVESPSKFKQGLLNLKKGDKVYAVGPYGIFSLKAKAKHHVMLAGGIGITAFRSILKQAALGGDVSKVTLLYSGKDQKFLFGPELEELAAQYPGLQIHTISSPERINAEMVKKHIADPKDATFYISGPKPMVVGLSKELQSELRIPARNIKKDSFKGYPWPLSD